MWVGVFFVKKSSNKKLLPRLLLCSSNFTVRNLPPGLALDLEAHLGFRLRLQLQLLMPRADQECLRLLSNPRSEGRRTLAEKPAECFVRFSS